MCPKMSVVCVMRCMIFLVRVMRTNECVVGACARSGREVGRFVGEPR